MEEVKDTEPVPEPEPEPDPVVTPSDIELLKLELLQLTTKYTELKKENQKSNADHIQLKADFDKLREQLKNV